MTRMSGAGEFMGHAGRRRAGGAGEDRKGGDFVAPSVGDFRRPGFLHLINTNDRVHRDVGAADAFEFGFQMLFAGVDHQRGPLAENDIFDFDETHQSALADVACIDFINLALIVKADTVSALALHDVRCPGEVGSILEPGLKLFTPARHPVAWGGRRGAGNPREINAWAFMRRLAGLSSRHILP